MILSRLMLEVSKLPRLVEVTNENGEREFFWIKAASTKLGIMTAKVEEPLRSQLMKK